MLHIFKVKMPKGVGNKGKGIAKKKPTATPQEKKKPKKYVSIVLPPQESKTQVRPTTQDYNLRPRHSQVTPQAHTSRTARRRESDNERWRRRRLEDAGLIPKDPKKLLRLSCGKYC